MAENSDKLVQGTLDESSLLGLVLGKHSLVPQFQPELWQQAGPQPKQEEDCKSTKRLETLLLSVLQKFGAPKQRRPRNKERLPKRDATIFAAILLRHEGMAYCTFLHQHGLRPKWSDSNPATESYPKSYRSGNPWRKKVQDEKTRARTRMYRYTDEELADAFDCFLPQQIDVLRERLAVRALTPRSDSGARASVQ